MKKDDVVSCMLNSGIEVIGTLDTQTDTSIKLIRPMRVVLQQNNQLGLTTLMFSVSALDPISISKSNILVGPAQSREELVLEYQRVEVPQK